MKMVPILRRRCYWLLALALTGLFGCGGGGGGSSSGAPGTIPVATSPIQPTAVTESSVIINWVQNFDNADGIKIGTCSGSTVTDELGTYCAGDFNDLYTTSDPDYELTGLDSGTTYDTYYVSAYNTAGESNAYQVVFTTSTTSTTSSMATFYADIDNTVSSLQPDSVFDAGNLGVGCYWPDGSPESCTASLVHFDLGSLAGAEIESATLIFTVWYLGINPPGTDPPLTELDAPHDWQVTPIADTPWYGDQVTWNIAMNGSLLYRAAESKIFSAPTAANQQYQIDLANFVQNWVDGSWLNNGIILELTDYLRPAILPSDDAWSFFSTDTAMSVEPKLVVVYH